MFTEKHVLTNPYNHHKLSRTLSGFDVTTLDCTADKSSGWNGATVNLTPNAVADTQKFSGWSATGTTITNSSFNFAGSDVTAKANFETAKDITLQTDGNGAISADKSYGFVGDIVTLSNTASADYEFTGYSITGATLTGNQFAIENENVTAMAGFSAVSKAVTIGTQTWMNKNLAIDDGGSGIYTAHISANGVDFGTQYYYTTGAAKRIADTLDGWHLPTSTEWSTLFDYIGGSTAAGKILKSTSGWNNNGNGTDDYGFTVLPCGISNGSATTNVGNASYFCRSGSNMYIGMSYNSDSVSYVSNNWTYGSVRLVHD